MHLRVSAVNCLPLRVLRLPVASVSLVRGEHLVRRQQSHRAGRPRQQILPAQCLQHYRSGKRAVRRRCMHDHAVVGEQASGPPDERRHREPRQFRCAERDVGRAPHIVAAEVRDHVVEWRQRLVQAGERGAGIGMGVHDALRRLDRRGRSPHASPIRWTVPCAAYVAGECHPHQVMGLQAVGRTAGGRDDHAVPGTMTDIAGAAGIQPATTPSR